MNTPDVIELNARHLRRYYAFKYLRRRAALAKALAMGLPAEVIREVRRQVNNNRHTWRLLRDA